MASPEFVAAVEDGVSNGNASVSVAAPAGVASGHYQLVLLGIVSSSANVGATPSGWAQLFNESADIGGNESTTRVALYESTTATDAFTMTLTSGRVWGAIRAGWSIPDGSSGRTITPTIALDGSASTSHTLPSVTTTTADSLIIGFGQSETNPDAQTWGTGAMTSRQVYDAENSTERMWLVLGDVQRASAGPGSPATFTTSASKRCYTGAVVLNGAAAAATPRGLFLPF